MTSRFERQFPIPAQERLILWGLLAPLVYFSIAHFPILARYSDNDTLRSASMFIEFWRALNHQGEIAWWSMETQWGHPVYVNLLAILSGKTLLFSLVSLVVWALGAVGIQIDDFPRLFTLYNAAVVPLALMASAHYLAGALLRTPAARLYVAMAAGFSPGALAGLTDLAMVEPGIFAMTFLGAWLRFVAAGSRAGRRAFFTLVFWLAAFLYTLSYPSLQGSLLLAPLAALWPLFSRPRRRRLWAALATIGRRDWLAAGAVLVLALAPTLVFALELGLYERRSIGGLAFDGLFNPRMKPGNPLQLLLAGVPMANFGWQGPHFIPRGETAYVTFGYLGLLSLPLALIGILHGRPALRWPLIILAAVLPMLLVLNNGHPFTAAFLSLPTPFQSNRHFPSLFFRVVGFLPLIFAAGAGVEALARNRGRARRHAPWLAGGFIVAAIGVLLARHQQPSIWIESPNGLAALLGAAMLLLLTGLRQAGRPRVARQRMGLLLALICADLAGFAYWHVNFQLLPLQRAFLAETTRNGGGESFYWANNHLALREVGALERRGVVPGRLPWLDLFCSVHPAAQIGPAQIDRALAADPQQRSLALDPGDLARPAFQAIGALPDGISSGPSGSSGAIGVTRRVNDLLELRVDAPAPCVLFWRDAFHPHWRAEVNGVDVPVAHALGAFKAVALPEGSATVRFSFRPTTLLWSLALAHAAMAALLSSLMITPSLRPGPLNPRENMGERWSEISGKRIKGVNWAKPLS